MLNNEIITRRLAIIKYLYMMGVQQSKQSETIAGFSILSFHDCIEMFLLLIAEYSNTKIDKLSFMDFWDKFPSLTLKESMRAVKDRRVSVKHKGQFPSKSDIEISRISVTDFLIQNTKIQFAIDFENVSLLDLIAYTGVKDYLMLSEKSLVNNNYDDSLMNSSFAFHNLIEFYESNKVYWYKKTFDLGGKIGKEYEYLIGRSSNSESHWFKEVTNTLNKIREVSKLTGLGIDYKKYSVFKLLTPEVYKDVNGNYTSLYKMSDKEVILNKDNCQFCVDFVLECAIKLQEFDFDLKEFIHTRD